MPYLRGQEMIDHYVEILLKCDHYHKQGYTTRKFYPIVANIFECSKGLVNAILYDNNTRDCFRLSREALKQKIENNEVEVSPWLSNLVGAKTTTVPNLQSA